jgi:hypothetical protein
MEEVLTAEQGAEKSFRTCRGGIFHPVRAAKFIRVMAKPSRGCGTMR